MLIADIVFAMGAGGKPGIGGEGGGFGAFIPLILGAYCHFHSEGNQ